MGWDGTLWAIDKSGAPHLYNETEQQWQLQGQGISAAAVVPDNSELHSTLYLFRGGEFVTVAPAGNYPTSAPKTIAAQWPHLPETFKMGVVGATGEGTPALVENASHCSCLTAAVTSRSTKALARHSSSPI